MESGHQSVLGIEIGILPSKFEEILVKAGYNVTLLCFPCEVFKICNMSEIFAFVGGTRKCHFLV